MTLKHTAERQRRFHASRVVSATVVSVILSILLGAVSDTARAQTLPAGELSSRISINRVSGSTLKQLEQVQVFIEDAQWEDAVDRLRKVMETDGDRLIEVPPLDETQADFRHYVSLREHCYVLLSKWSRSAPEVLRLYRRRVDPLARLWYRQAVTERDSGLLQRIVDEMFASSFGDDALLLLGEHLLERGDPNRARWCWERISPLMRTPACYEVPLFNAGPGRPLWLGIRGLDLDQRWPETRRRLTEPESTSNWLSYPDTDLELGQVRARLALVSILEGAADRAEAEIRLLERIDPAATGHLAGRDGRFVELLDALLETSRGWRFSASRHDWPTFAGAETRDPPVTTEASLSGRPLWEASVPRIRAESEVLGFRRRRVGEHGDELTSYHPIVLGERVVWSEPDMIRVLDLRTGEAVWPVEDRGERDEARGAVFRNPFPESSLPEGSAYVGAPRYTLSSDGRRVFARMGSPVTVAASGSRVLQRQLGYIIGLDLSAQGKILPGFPYVPEDELWAFDGSPVVKGQRMFVAMRRRDLPGIQAHVACYDLDETKLLWRTMVCGGATLGNGQLPEVSHNLLTVDRGTIFFNSNLGAVAALRADDGRIEWVMQYPRATAMTDDPDESRPHFFRDLTPGLLFRGNLIVAPSDCDRMFCLDAATGRLNWTTRPGQAEDVVHLLGVGEGYLIASGEHLYWFDVHSGNLLGQFPAPTKLAPGHASPSPRGLGRGLLAGDHVYWPTRDSIFVFRQDLQVTPRGRSPVMARVIDLPPRNAGGGNLLMAEGVLLLATESKVVAFDAGSDETNESEESNETEETNDTNDADETTSNPDRD